MTIDEFISLNDCDVVYHMSEKGSWPLIQKLGLLSTSSLLDLCGYTGTNRARIESNLRHAKEKIRHPKYGDIYILDQIPMRDWPDEGIFLDKLLEDVTRQQWFEFLNKKVFFWVTRYELIKMLCAWQYRGQSQWIMIVDTRALLEQYQDNAYLSVQNTGSLYSRRKRGINTFVPFNACPRNSNIIELAIDHGVPNIVDLTISVEEGYCIKITDGERKYKKVDTIWSK